MKWCRKLLLLLCCWPLFKPHWVYSSTITGLEPRCEVDARFLSVAIDSHLIAERWKDFDFSSKRVLNMARALAPAYLRIGGTAADLLTFRVNPLKKSKIKNIFEDDTAKNSTATPQTLKNSCMCRFDKKIKTKFFMSGRDWILLNEFAQYVNWSILFDVNVLKRNKQKDKWSPSNARKLMKFSILHGYTNLTWELGNEPNSLKHQLGFQMNPYQLGKDFKQLRKLLNRFPAFQKSSLVGPDVNQLRAQNKEEKAQKALHYLQKVYKGSLKKYSGSRQSVLDALTWHHYYLNGHTATLEDFLDVQHLDYFPKMVKTVGTFLQQNDIQKPLWLGETSSAYGGGAKGISDRYVAAFLWLDKLGIAAYYNYQVVIRQTFFHGCYALIGKDLYPNPDFWISALYKTLVSTKVLQIMKKEFNQENLRMYAHCGKIEGTVVIYGLNLNNKTSKLINLDLPKFESLCSFVLTPSSTTNNGLTSRSIFLNGKLLRLNPDDTVPDLIALEHCQVKNEYDLHIPPFGMAFWLLREIDLPFCQFSSESNNQI